jgi:hypothetical protein
MSAGPRMGGVSVGREALEARALELQQQSQGLVFTKAIPVYQALDFGYLAWHLGRQFNPDRGLDKSAVHGLATTAHGSRSRTWCRSRRPGRRRRRGSQC